MSTPKDRLEAPYKATSAETVDLLTGVAQRMVNSDGPLLAWSQVADVTANGASKYARGDWRTRSQEYFLPKILRHLRQHYGYSAFRTLIAEIDEQEDIEEGKRGYLAAQPQLIDAESGQPHLARAATNILMCLENCGNIEESAELPVTAEELGMVYLAQPYTTKPSVSYLAALDIAARGIQDGVKLYSPIAFGHLVAPQASYDYWLEHGLDMLRRCDSLVLVQDENLGPWVNSPGCVKEHALALELGKKVYQFNTAEWKLVRL